MSTWEEYADWVEKEIKTLFVGITTIISVYLIISNLKAVSKIPNILINL
jgi:hypothetical protein